jgi:primosomal protein N' (replication factor Y)
MNTMSPSPFPGPVSGGGPRVLPPPPDLFAAPAPAVGPSDSVYAEVVFDRPLDHTFTYVVPEALHGAVGPGRRVEVPFGKGDRRTAGFCVRVHADAPPRAVKQLLRVLDTEALVTEPLLRLTRWMADYYLCGWGQVLHALVPAGVRGRAGLREEVLLEAIPVADLKPPLLALSEKQKYALAVLRESGRAMTPKELAGLARCGPGVASALVTKGFARQSVHEVEVRGPGGSSPGEPAGPPLVLNDAQNAALATVESAIAAGGFRPFLLHGVTGSGKTEVYLQAIEAVTARGREAIVLVPEISLTPQTIERFAGRCGPVAVLHSHLTEAERAAQWRRVAAGQVKVVVGARSAVFAPTRNLGLIVIDEEHETSFKQESTPRYHARDVAVVRARLEGVPVLMGSATPALESWHNARRGQYELLSLPNRVEDRPLPSVGLIDLRHERPTGGKFSAISPTLEQAIRQSLDDGGQVMLLLNRRGFSTHVHCPDCGHVATCEHCDLALTFHRQRAALVCHYCGFEQLPMDRCPACKTTMLRYRGLGTEKLQAEVEQKFPGRVVQRMDSDTMQRPGSHQRVLEAFRGGLIQVLLGTQMIAKGLDFPNVTLVGVVNADTGLHLPDFRAGERTFQLLAQVAGRAGRGPKGGRVLVQTHTPEHACISLAAKHDYTAFAERELAQREAFQYPPYQRLARLIVRSQDEAAASGYVATLAGEFQRELKAAGGTAVRVLGPAEAPVYRLNGYFRFHFQLQSAQPAALHRVLRAVLAVVQPPKGVEYQVDIDPYGMM